jgi:site-specific recombinase XerC
MKFAVLYGSRVKLIECMDLRIKDFDFELNEIIVRYGKGNNDLL